MGTQSLHQRVPESGIVTASSTAQLVSLTDPKWPVIYLKNLDGTNRIVVKIGDTSTVEASAAGTDADYDSQLVLETNEAIRVAVDRIQWFSVAASAGSPQLVWRTGRD